MYKLQPVAGLLDRGVSEGFACWILSCGSSPFLASPNFEFGRDMLPTYAGIPTEIFSGYVFPNLPVRCEALVWVLR